MHIIENFNGKMGYKYCYANVCYWNKDTKKYVNDRTPIGKLIGEPPSFVPNKPFLRMLGEDSSTSSERVKAIIAAAVKKYGDEILELGNVEPSLPKGTLNCQTATSSFVGPAIVFGGITKRYGIDALLHQAFGLNDGNDILALAWYMASEGSALSNSDQWLCYYDNPRGSSLSSQEITGLLDRMNTDGVMTFYKGWLANFERLNNLANTKDHVLYDLTSISYSGKNIALSNWGRIRDSEDLPQVNLALLCARNTSMPLFSWPLEESISDTKTLKNTLEFLANLGYKPDCLMMDRGFSSMDNISYLFQHDIAFLQAVRVNSNWIRNVIDAGRINRLSPDSKLVVDNRSYYCSTTHCHWVAVKKETRKGFVEDVIVTIPDGSIKSKTYIPLEKNFKIVSQHKCMVHVLFCQDLVGKQWDRFMDDLKVEHDRLVSNENAEVKNEFSNFFEIEKPKYARKRIVAYNFQSIEKHRSKYAGHICFITNDHTVPNAADALREYSTRDYIEKDFDELKNDLDMSRIRVHTDGRMTARLLIQFIAQIFLREIRVKIRNSPELQKLSKTQIMYAIKAITKITFKDKNNKIAPELSKTQREIIEALGLSDTRLYT